ncbi:PIPO protein [Gomphocarpus mosaic virus]|uniref:PIPO protein n=1 Tax=Gomphocarpus mosaic virus TaxID=1972994 RepID=A0A348AZK2_9POTV|nr:PIPO protein [Gomphocarpus mosaic virus]BBD33994.1 PIPO protein [Gomphocarpus mosaic virus]
MGKNLRSKVAQGMARARLVGKILFNKALLQTQEVFFRCFAKRKWRRGRSQVRNIIQLVLWKDQGSPQWNKKVHWPTGRKRCKHNQADGCQ